MKKKTDNKANYFFTREDMHIKSTCLKYGYKIFPAFHPQQAWVRYEPLIILCGTYKGKLYQLINKPFDQNYLGYYTIIFYRKYYDKHVLKNLEVKEEVVVSAPPPPPQVLETKSMFAPPPPN